MDGTIRRNQICVVGLPRCDFVFSSTRTCFIAYGFRESPLEMSILRHLLEDRKIQPVEAGGTLAPGQNAFCAKICSKIITSQFCVVLINNDESEGQEIPNANVNMEYGLMLGFNKYVIPFQRTSQRLPFNVAGLDTVKYNNADFERVAATAIDQAIRETQQDAPPSIPLDQVFSTFLLSKQTLITNVNNPGEQNLFQLGFPLGFNLLNDFSGWNYIYFGNFTALRTEVVVWRIKMLSEILDRRRAAVNSRVAFGITTEKEARLMDELFGRLKIWIAVNSYKDKISLELELESARYPLEVFSLDEVKLEVDKLSGPA
jgi:hypothetical protein